MFRSGDLTVDRILDAGEDDMADGGWAIATEASDANGSAGSDFKEWTRPGWWQEIGVGRGG